MFCTTSASRTLAVAIPTFKRPALLAKCLNSVVLSIGASPVNIHIYDDSTDDTNDHVYEEFARKNVPLTITRNPRNLGIDRNICNCLENTDAEFVWLMGEDDLMGRDSISHVLRAIDGNTGVNYIFANYSLVTSDYKHVLLERSIDVADGSMNFERFFRYYLWSAGFIGACIVRREAFLRTRYRDFLGTYYAHVAGITLAAKGNSIGTIGMPLVGNRVGDVTTFTWGSDTFGVFQGWRRMLLGLKAEMGAANVDLAWRSHKTAHGYLSWKYLIARKAEGLLTISKVRELSKDFVSDEEGTRMIFVARWIPQTFCKVLRTLYFSLRKLRFSLDRSAAPF